MIGWEINREEKFRSWSAVSEKNLCTLEIGGKDFISHNEKTNLFIFLYKMELLGCLLASMSKYEVSRICLLSQSTRLYYPGTKNKQ